ncbi:MAG: fatty acid--CoA ligase family protein [Chthoniobacteraceae bacterium]
MKNIVEHIFRNADRSAPALICGETEFSYGQLVDLADAAARAIGAVPAARVGLECPNGVTHVVLALAIVRAGKCLVPIAGELAPPERERVLRETGVGAMVREDGSIEPISLAKELPFDEGALAQLNPAFIRFSSGTTGHSKGIVLSHAGLFERVTAANRGLGISPSDRVVWVLPMAHHFAVSIMLYLLHGAATVIVDSHLPADILAAGRSHRGTVLYGAPFHHAALAAEGSANPWPYLRLAVSTAAPLREETALAFLSRYGLPLTQGLGIIEVGLPLLNLTSAREKPQSVGRPMPGYAAEIREGELLLRGPGLLDAYLHPWRTRETILDDGWFHTGDLAGQDADGDIFIEGRAHSVINVAGLKCFPEEIEQVLCEHAAVKQARVFGKTNTRAGAVPVAEIVPADLTAPPSVAGLVAHCRAALAGYKVPVDFRFVENLALTPSGKIKR